MAVVAVDAMGGDHAPGEIIKGVCDALGASTQLKVLLVGREEVLKSKLEEYRCPPERLEVVHAGEIISGEDDPGLSIRRKKDASLVVALRQAREGRADAVLSAGNTGALMSGGLLFMGRIKGISRPGLLTTLPTFYGSGVAVLDVGANMDATPEQMVQYAFMGKAYAEKILHRDRARIGLLSVGTENNKGNDQVRKAHQLFKEYLPEFIGNVEGSQVFSGEVDVVVCDGFAGNVLLKTAEGISRGIFGVLKEVFTQNAKNKLGAMLVQGSLKDLQRKMDDTEYGGAPLVGINGICIKCHGSSRARAIERALLDQVNPWVKTGVNEVFSFEMQKSGWLQKEMKQ